MHFDFCQKGTVFCDEYDCFDWCMKRKAEGKSKHFGFSFHGSPELLEKILDDHPEVEFVQIQLNYLDRTVPFCHSISFVFFITSQRISRFFSTSPHSSEWLHPG